MARSGGEVDQISDHGEVRRGDKRIAGNGRPQLQHLCPIGLGVGKDLVQAIVVADQLLAEAHDLLRMKPLHAVGFGIAVDQKRAIVLVEFDQRSRKIGRAREIDGLGVRVRREELFVSRAAQKRRFPDVAVGVDGNRVGPRLGAEEQLVIAHEAALHQREIGLDVGNRRIAVEGLDSALRVDRVELIATARRVGNEPEAAGKFDEVARIGMAPSGVECLEPGDARIDIDEFDLAIRSETRQFVDFSWNVRIVICEIGSVAENSHVAQDFRPRVQSVGRAKQLRPVKRGQPPKAQMAADDGFEVDKDTGRGRVDDVDIDIVRRGCAGQRDLVDPFHVACRADDLELTVRAKIEETVL